MYGNGRTVVAISDVIKDRLVLLQRLGYSNSRSLHLSLIGGTVSHGLSGVM